MRSKSKMKKFLDENFLLQNKIAVQLYNDFAKPQPIIDYHNHLPPDQIANDINFQNITQVWLYGDHYKWRAMRTNGINEKYCTGNASDYEKFENWAATVPYTMRNPLYHWTHLDLQRYFGIHTILNADSAKAIYDEASAKLQTHHPLLLRMQPKPHPTYSTLRAARSCSLKVWMRSSRTLIRPMASQEPVTMLTSTQVPFKRTSPTAT